MHECGCIKDYFPSAIRITPAGRCPDCKQWALVSFVLDGLDFGDPPNPRYEYCGYFCEYCEWSNAGERIRPVHLIRE